MKVVYPDGVTAVEADEEASLYPADNMIDGHPKSPWHATSADAEVKLTVSAGASGVALFETNATSVTITVKDATETSTLWGPSVVSISADSVLAEYTTQAVEHKVIMALSLASGTLEVGQAVAGPVLEFPSPDRKNLQRGFVDYSVKKTLNSGGTYYKVKDVVDTIKAKVNLSNADYNSVSAMFKVLGPTPLAWVVTDADDPVWASFNKAPSAVPYSATRMLMTIDLIEEL